MSGTTPPTWKSLYVEIVLIIIGCILIGYAWLFYATPDVFPAATHAEILVVKYPSDSTVIQASSGINYTVLTPTVKFEIDTTFEAQGGYGADNPITIHATITEANTTLTDYYCQVLFTDASSPSPNAYEGGWLNLIPHDNGTYYTADGTLEWATGGPTYTWLAPCVPSGFVGYTYWSVGMDVINPNGSRQPTLTIDPISSTQDWQNAQLYARLEMTGIGVLIIGPYEGLKRLVGR